MSVHDVQPQHTYNESIMVASTFNPSPGEQRQGNLWTLLASQHEWGTGPSERFCLRKEENGQHLRAYHGLHMAYKSTCKHMYVYVWAYAHSYPKKKKKSNHNYNNSLRNIQYKELYIIHNFKNLMWEKQ